VNVVRASRKAIVAAGLAASLAGALAACGGAGRPQAAPAGDLDTHHPGDVDFFSRLAPRNALLAPSPQGLREGVEQSHVVLVGEVVDVRPTRTVGEPGAQASYMGIVVKPTEILRGKPAAETPEVIVEFMASPTADDTDPVATARKSLPQGKALWFLHWKGELPKWAKPKPGAPPISQESKQYYSLVHLRGGLALQGEDGVVAPTAEDEPSGAESGPSNLKSEINTYRKMSELVAAIREIE